MSAGCELSLEADHHTLTLDVWVVFDTGVPAARA